MQIVKVEYIRKDKRGILIQINTGLWKQVNYLTIKKDEAFGGHYHRHKEELFYLIKGAVKVEIINKIKQQGTRLSFKKGECFLIEPMEKHTLYALKNSELVELLSEPYSQLDTISE